MGQNVVKYEQRFNFVDLAAKAEDLCESCNDESVKQYHTVLSCVEFWQINLWGCYKDRSTWEGGVTFCWITL